MKKILELEHNFLPELIRAELIGIPINLELINQEGNGALSAAGTIKATLKEQYNLNPNSSKQCVKILNEKGIPVVSSVKSALAPYKNNPIVKSIQDSKTKKKRGDLLLKMDSERIYPCFNQIEAPSGRMSCSKPNMQQIPRDVKDTIYKAPDGYKIIKADYPAIELRIAAVVANEPVMIKAFKEDKDLHRLTASLISGKPYDAITKEERQQAKAVNFGLIYGMGAETLKSYALTSYGVEMSLEKAKKIREGYFKAYPSLRTWHYKTGAELNEFGIITVKTLYGREVMTDKYTNALNIPVQGSGADLLKLAVVNFNKKIRGDNFDARIINLVHDEIVVESSARDVEPVATALKESMEDEANKMIRLFKTEIEIEVLERVEDEQL